MNLTASNNCHSRPINLWLIVMAGILMLGFVSGCATTPPPPASQPSMSQPASPNSEHLAGIGSETLVTVHGKIVSVDREKMLVTIEGPNGKPVTVHVYNPYNLAAAKPGEPFVARFYEVVTVRKKLPGEVIPAASLQQGIISASPGQTPERLSGTSCNLLKPSPRSIRSRTQSS